MDPISQGTVGVAFAQSSASKNNILKISLIFEIVGDSEKIDTSVQVLTQEVVEVWYKLLNLYQK